MPQVTELYTMVENGKEYVVQWPGHGTYVTERFSGLLARQSLVDVTLMCEEHQLRAHKLVLASCSLYFEEILNYDLGQDPIIVLKDLHFEILKAMIEFMYCGETTVPHWHLPSLLNAARVFKVPELESLVENMVGSYNCNEDYNENNCEYICDEESKRKPFNDNNDGVQVIVSDKSSGQRSSLEITESSDTESERNRCFEIGKEDLDCCSYQNSKEAGTELSMCKNSEVSHDCCTIDTNANSREVCQNITNECSESQKSPCGSVDSADSLQVGQCVQVYSYKRHKIKDDSKEVINIDHWPTANGIDLTDESSNDDTQVTLEASLDMTSWDYISNFSSENIQSIIGCSLTNSNLVTQQKDEEKEGEQPPVLRRSVRLNQLDSDGVSSSRESPVEDKLKREHLPRKRKHKDSDHQDVNKKKLTGQRRSKSKEVTKAKPRNKLKYARLRKLDTIQENPPCDTIIQPNTTPSVNRALWGDMGDLSEDGITDVEFMNYSTSAEIPFAVGLLPLRVALERMQATLDHQPRKTRSSVASLKQDNTNTKKRVTNNGDVGVSVNANGDCLPKENGSSAVCHIEIRTAPQYPRPRKRSMSESETRWQRQEAGTLSNDRHL